MMICLKCGKSTKELKCPVCGFDFTRAERVLSLAPVKLVDPEALRLKKEKQQQALEKRRATIARKKEEAERARQRELEQRRTYAPQPQPSYYQPAYNPVSAPMFGNAYSPSSHLNTNSEEAELRRTKPMILDLVKRIRATIGNVTDTETVHEIWGDFKSAMQKYEAIYKRIYHTDYSDMLVASAEMTMVFSDALQRIRDDEQREREDQQRRERERRQQDEWARQGRCRHCGGTLSFIGKRCKSCGRNNY